MSIISYSIVYTLPMSTRKVLKLTDIPNIGEAIQKDLHLIGIRKPDDLKSKDPYVLYKNLNKRTRTRHDPCLLDTFMAAVDYMNGAPERPWFYYTKKRKVEYPDI